MAVARELVADVIDTPDSITKGRGKVLVFGEVLQNADRVAFERYNRSRRRLGLPRSYAISARRALIIDDQDSMVPVVAVPKILGERAVNWSHLKSPHATDFLNTELSIRGAFPKLGRVVRRGQMGWKTIVERGVTIDYFPGDLNPIVEVKDRLPKRNSECNRNSDAAGVEQDEPSGVYFGVELLATRFPHK